MANAIIKSDKHPEFKERYRELKARHGHKKAIIAICHMILTAIWNILSKQEPYTAEGYYSSAERPANKGKTVTISQALNILRLRGYTINDVNVELELKST